MQPLADERYDFERLLGEGPAARAWLVRDRAEGGQQLTLKEFRGPTDGHASRLGRELHDQARWVHPGLAGIHGPAADSASDRPRVVREFVDGRSVASHLRDRGVEALPGVAAEALRVLDWLEALGRPHGSLTPGNVRVRKHPRAAYRVALLDGGVLSAPAATASKLPYLAPERLGGDPPTIAADVYSLGIVLFEALHGRTPHRVPEGGPAAWLSTIAAGRRVRPAAPGSLPAALTGWLEALICPEPGARPGPREALRELAALAGAALVRETGAATAARLAGAVAVVRGAAVRFLWDQLSPTRDPRLIWVCGGTTDERDVVLHHVAAEAAGRDWAVTLVAESSDRAARTIAAYLAEYERMQRGRPGLLVLPHFSRAGGDAVDALQRVLLGGGTPALRVVVGLDPDGITDARLGRLVARAGRGTSLRRIDLGPLTGAEIATLTRMCGSTLDATALTASTKGDADRVGAALIAGDEAGNEQDATRRLRAELSSDACDWLRSDDGAACAAADEAVCAGLAYRLDGRPLARDRRFRQVVALAGRAEDGAVDVEGPAETVAEPPGASGIDIGLAALAALSLGETPDDVARRLRQELAATGRDIDAGVRSRTALATVLVAAGRLGDAISLARQASELAARCGDLDAVAEASALRAIALGRCGHGSDARRMLETSAAGAADADPAPGAAATEATRLAAIEVRMEVKSEVRMEVRSEVRGAGYGACAEARMHAMEPLEPHAHREAWRRTLELECLAWAGASGFASAHADFTERACGGAPWNAPWWTLRAELAAVRHLGRSGNVEAAVEAARRFHERARGTFPALAAEAAATGVDALRAARRPHEARELAAAGRRSLDVAADRVGDGALRAGFLERSVFTPLREGAAAAQRRLRALYEMSRALNSENDPETLLEAILDMALEVVAAERGMILLRDDHGKLAVRLARNLERQTVADAEEFSRSVAMQAGAGRPILAVDTLTDERTRGMKSVSAFGIRSVLCVPLRSRGSIAGVVYLDSRTEGATFSADDLEFLEAFSDHAALALENARIRRRLELENERLQVTAEARAHFGNIVGESDVMREVFALIEKIAVSELPVLIQGDSGTGKELVARAIHFNSERRKRAFVTQNCAAVPESLLQSEMFGHVRGAFTGADRDRPGLFEQADRGTLFLDEVGDMSPGMQAQLLRALEDGEVRRVGSEHTTRVDVRVIAATHHDLQATTDAGNFRSDLLYRLQVLSVHVPPLRERGDDMALLVGHFVTRMARERGRAAPAIDPQLLELLGEYPWPGNVRQVENVLQRLLLLAGDGPLTRELVRQDPWLGRTFGGGPAPASAPGSLARSERERIRAALEASDGSRARAARMLGISRATIYRKIGEFEL